MFEVLLQLAEASELPIYIGRGSVSVDASPIRGETEAKPDPGVYAGFPRRHGDVYFATRSEFDDGYGGQLPPLKDIPQLGQLFRRQGASNAAGFYLGDEPLTFTTTLGPTSTAEVEVNESTETGRKFDDYGVDYSCKDKKRDSTVHRAFMRR